MNKSKNRSQLSKRHPLTKLVQQNKCQKHTLNISIFRYQQKWTQFVFENK